MKKGIYVGPPHFWHRYALNPRERYYYGYSGMYGPHTDLRHYKPIKEEFRWSDGCHDNKTLVESAVGVGAATMVGTMFYMVLMWIAVTFALKLAIEIFMK